MKVTCPKCKSPNAWVRKTETDLILICFCGHQKVLFTTLIESFEGPLDDDEDTEKTILPAMGTHLYKTLVVLSILPGGSSKEITERLNELNGLMRGPGLVIRKDLMHTVSDVSSYLTILRGKGLVERTSNKRGLPGGSNWDLTSEALELLDITEGV
jgi:hypothetical protein